VLLVSIRLQSTSVRLAILHAEHARIILKTALHAELDLLTKEFVFKCALSSSSALKDTAKLAILSVTVVLMSATTASTVLLASIDVELFARTPVIPISSPIQSAELASLATPTARHAPVRLSVPPARTLRLFPSTEFVMIAHILAELAAPVLHSADHALQDSTLSESPASLLVLEVLLPSMVSVSVLLDSSLPTNVLLNVLPDLVQSVVSAQNALKIVLLVSTQRIFAPSAITAMPSTLLLLHVRLPLPVNSVSSSPKLPMLAQEFALRTLSTTSQFASLLVFWASRITESEDVCPKKFKPDALSLTS